MPAAIAAHGTEIPDKLVEDLLCHLRRGQWRVVGYFIYRGWFAERFMPATALRETAEALGMLPQSVTETLRRLARDGVMRTTGERYQIRYALDLTWRHER